MALTRTERVMIGGTHRVGKSTLVQAVADALPRHATVDEPNDQLEEEGYAFSDPPPLEDFEAQLERSLLAGSIVPPRARGDHSGRPRRLRESSCSVRPTSSAAKTLRAAAHVANAFAGREVEALDQPLPTLESSIAETIVGASRFRCGAREWSSWCVPNPQGCARPE
jgi:hypothetical protein